MAYFFKFTLRIFTALVAICWIFLGGIFSYSQPLLATARAESYTTNLASDTASDITKDIASPSPVTKIYVPQLFDSHTRAQIILHGYFRNSCAHPLRSGFKLFQEQGRIEVWAQSDLALDAQGRGPHCEIGRYSFLQIVDLGQLPAGEYRISYTPHTQLTTTPLVITEYPDGHANSQSGKGSEKIAAAGEDILAPVDAIVLNKGSQPSPNHLASSKRHFCSAQTDKPYCKANSKPNSKHSNSPIREQSFKLSDHRRQSQITQDIYKLKLNHRQQKSVAIGAKNRELNSPQSSPTVESADALGEQITLTLSGTFPYLYQGCMRLKDVQVTLTPDAIVVVKPIAEIAFSAEACPNSASSYKFAATVPLPPVPAKNILIHVRLPDGVSLNRLITQPSRGD